MVFEKDEMEQKKVNPEWSAEDLLNQEGIFFLKDISAKLELDPVKFSHVARNHVNPREVGIIKMWESWAVRMKVFAPYYRSHLKSPYRSIPEGMDGNGLLAMSGTFLLTDVCDLIPFSAHQIRYQAKAKPGRAREEFGVSLDSENRWVVDMPIFSKWIKELWKNTNGWE